MAFRKLAYLGDSLTDSDEYWTLSRQVLIEPLPDQAYYAHQFSNGRVHSDIVPWLLGVEGGDAYNYAFAGGRAVGSLAARSFVDDPSWLKVPVDDPLLDTDVNLGAQTNRLLTDAAAGDWDLPGFAVNVWIGLNDLSHWTPSSSFPWQWAGEIADLVDDIVRSIRDNTAALIEAGMGEVWVSSLPSETFFPYFNEVGGLTEYVADGVIDDLNAALDEMVDAFRDDGDPVRLLDMHLMTREIEADPISFGLWTIEESYLLGTGGEYDPEVNPYFHDFDFATDADRIGFVDLYHPTTAMHGVLAAFEAEAMAGRLVAGTTDDDVLEGRGGSDLVLARSGDDSVKGRAGQDVLLGGKGDDALSGGDGSDLLQGGAGDDVLHGNARRDLLAGGFGDDRLHGGRNGDVLVETSGADRVSGWKGDDLFLWFDPALSDTRIGDDHDLLAGGSGDDRAIFYLADRGLYRAARAEYAAADGAKEFELDTLNVSVTGIESVSFVDLSDGAFERPETGSSTLEARLDEAHLWGFV